MENLVIESCYGFGDHLFIRPSVLATAEKYPTYIVTAYPELYRDTKVKCVQIPKGQYSFCDKMREIGRGWTEYPEEGRFIRPNFSSFSISENETISSAYTKGFPEKKYDTRIIPTEHQRYLGRCLLNTDDPVMLVKVPSYSPDWRCKTRPPKTEYMAECMRIAKERGLRVVSLRGEDDLFEEPEKIEAWDPYVDQFLHRKLTIDELIGVFSQADCVLGYPGFVVPLAIYLDKPIFTIYGGHVHPSIIIDPRIMPKHYEYVAPDPFCNCVMNEHECNKEISLDYLRDKFNKFLDTRHESDELYWDETMGYGYYPVKSDGVYNDDYFRKYEEYEATEFGRKLNSARADIVKKVIGGCLGRSVIDIGIGSGQFVRSVDGYGFDVCPKAINWLKDSGRWVDFYKRGAYQVQVVTFFDSFEHIEDLRKLIKMCMGRTIVISIPIFKDKAHAISSKHFRKDEHYHYFTDFGLKNWFGMNNYKCLLQSSIESDLGRDGIGTYVFEYKHEEVTHE